ncbi:Two component transcriptional regulator [Paraburkholderia tropica]|uniref:response regulator transcription factor n=1 Tax=Paraburkholderia TaxID=1822464 RepID=UPI001CB25B62|nr:MULTISPECIES: response regulator transcription factor [Paraburkholderia]CAG9238585.1 Two component transcriptional regulator [Paraburkholderia tropica]
MHILIVEDDPIQAQAVSGVLSRHNFSVSVVNDGEAAIGFLKTETVDAVLLDWHLPGMSGVEVLHWIRHVACAEYGVLFLTSRVQELDVVRALEEGADDYLAKPFRSDELVARVHALVRRVVRNANNKIIRAGEYVVDQQSRSIALRGSEVSLTTKEFQLAATLFNNLGKILSRELLAMTAWGRELGAESRSLDTHIYRIRQKLKLRPENGVRLSSVYTAGYRLESVAQPVAGSET